MTKQTTIVVIGTLRVKNPSKAFTMDVLVVNPGPAEPRQPAFVNSVNPDELLISICIVCHSV